MHVIATAGHVDHGKSTLVQALTGRHPDRLAEERRRGLTIELGFAWTALADGTELAFVDVPGHQKFLATTLAGLGPVPAVLFVVAADEGWRRQSSEHLAALDALGVRHGLIVVTRTDLASPGPAADQAAKAMAGTSLAGLPWVGVSATTGAGLAELRIALATLAGGLPVPRPPARQRLWVDRVFSRAGAGTVVTGTLAAGELAVGDTLATRQRVVTIRGLQSLGQQRDRVTGTARVAVALRGVERDELPRGEALVTPGAWTRTEVVDVRVTGGTDVSSLPRELVLHIGTAAIPVRQRMLSPSHLRLQLGRALPLEPGDRALLRDPGRQRVAAGLVIVDAEPPVLDARGAARTRAAELAARGDQPDPVAEVARRGFLSRADAAALGLTVEPLPDALLDLDGQLVTRAHLAGLTARLTTAITRYAREHPRELGAPRETLRNALGVPNAGILDELVRRAGCHDAPNGRVSAAAPRVPDLLAGAAAELAQRWHRDPLDAPDADELRRLALDDRALGTLQAAGRLLRLSRDVAVGPGAPERARARLAELPQPFTAGAARTALESTRRVVIPLLEFLDAQRITRRDDTGQRTLRG